MNNVDVCVCVCVQAIVSELLYIRVREILEFAVYFRGGFLMTGILLYCSFEPVHYYIVLFPVKRNFINMELCVLKLRKEEQLIPMRNNIYSLEIFSYKANRNEHPNESSGENYSM